ncbi:MAG: ligase-associated DNA damage response exonuclease [Acidobacteriia bacterium]|nr:ligase-associated DNA damage response exonuclease [Terriglobia bacterium]
MPLLELRDEGLYCAPGGFYIDPWGPVDRAVITHAHPDRARPGSKSYLTSNDGEALLRMRLGPQAVIQAVAYGESLTLGEARVTAYPAGHMLGSAQIRIEHAGEVWVFSGDYKLASDSTCAGWEPAPCDVFVTEATFGLPIFRWPSAGEVRDSIHAWWRANQQAGRASLLFANPLGKAQRLLALIDSALGPIFVHEEIERVNQIYRARGVQLAGARLGDGEKGWAGALVLAPPEAHASAWAKRFGTASTALASGWMRIRGTRRRRSLDRGFVLSDHADWSGLLSAVEASGAESVWVVSGFRGPMVRWLAEHGRRSISVDTRFGEAEP